MKKEIYDEITQHLINVFKGSKLIEYKEIEFDDDEDINFLITPKIKLSKIKKNIDLKLIVYCSDEHQLTIYCPTLFRLKDNDSVMYTLNALNIVNSKIAIGKIYLNPNNSSIISYINRALFNDIVKELTTDLFEDYIASFIMTSIQLYEEIKDRYES